MTAAIDIALVDALLRGAGVGIALLLCVQMRTRPLAEPISKYGILFGLGAASYLICSAAWFSFLPAILLWPTLLFCMFNPLLFWLFARALFDDGFELRRTEHLVIAAFGTLVLAHLIAREASPGPLENLTGIIVQTGSLILVLHILFTILNGLAGDLLQRRRQLRVYVVSITGAYMFMIAVVEVALAGSSPPPTLMLVNGIGIVLLIAGLSFLATELNSDLFPLTTAQKVVPPAPSPAPSFDSELMDKAASAMEAGAYHDEKLTLDALADTIGVPAYRLRQAINQGLGYRNFNEFLNHYRLKEAAAGLVDPNKARLPILSVALHAGYNSISPFNRAFKEKYGLTPSEFRRNALGRKRPDS